MKNFFYFLLLFSVSSAVSEESFFYQNLHKGRMQILKNKGFNPKVIYDIGAHEGNWTQQIRKIYPDSQFILFEANEIHKPALEKTACPYFCVLLGNQEKTVTFYSNGTTGDSVFLEQTKYFKQSGVDYVEKNMKMIPLSSLISKHRIALPDFVKMDVQGAEKIIIEGGIDIIKHAEAIVIESKILEYNKGAPSAHEIMVLMDQLGYSLQDIFECHYLPSGELNEIDLLFVKKDSKLIKHGMLIK